MALFATETSQCCRSAFTKQFDTVTGGHERLTENVCLSWCTAVMCTSPDRDRGTDPQDQGICQLIQGKPAVAT